MFSDDKWNYRGLTIRAEHDRDAECPLDEDNESVRFVTFERNSTLSGYHDFSKPTEAPAWAEENGFAVYPLYKYEHGRVAYSTGGFSCPWDSGQAGFVLVRRADYGDDEARMAEIAKGMCGTVMDWCNGDCFGYTVEDDDGEELDSGWGFVGSDHDESGLREQAESAAAYAADKIAAEDAARLDENAIEDAERLEDSRPDMYVGP